MSSRRTLREAIEEVLREEGGGYLPIPEVYRKIRERELYLRPKDDSPPTKQQVYNAILNHADGLFRVDRSTRPLRVALVQGPERKPGPSSQPSLPPVPVEDGVAENQVQEQVRVWLKDRGWVLEQEAQGFSHGPDLVLVKGGRRLVVEVKGLPGKRYVRGPKKGQKKPTKPPLQMRHWFSSALVSLLRRRKDYPGALLALAFPYASTYRDLVKDTGWALDRLEVGVFWVHGDGRVEAPKGWEV